MMDVFVVEDEEMIRRLYADLLDSRGYRVIDTAENGKEALEKYDSMTSKPDLIIMDHRMPVMGGLEAARMIMKKDPDQRIVLVSADDNAVWESLKFGIVGMRKPFKICDLLNAIESSQPHEQGSERKKTTTTGIESGLYLFDEKNCHKGTELFRSLLDKGYTGMGFTREHPDHFRKMVGESDIPVAWFISSIVQDQTCISPLNIQKMLVMIQSAISEGGRTAILVHGFEYIISNMEFSRVLNLIQVINDRVMTSSDIVVIFSMDLGLLDKNEAAYLRKEFRTQG